MTPQGEIMTARDAIEWLNAQPLDIRNKVQSMIKKAMYAQSISEDAFGQIIAEEWRSITEGEYTKMTQLKTVQDLIDACNRGEKPILKVTGLVWDEFELDEGSFLRITGYLGLKYDHSFTYNFDEFKEYNRKLLKRNWVLKNGMMGTAEEFGAWENPAKALYFQEVSDPLYKYDLEHYTGNAREVLLTEIARLEKELSEYREKLAHLETENKVEETI